MESAASGLAAAINLDRQLAGKDPVEWDSRTVLGALACYISTENSNFQPMNANFGILSPISFGAGRVPKEAKKRALAERALGETDKIAQLIK